MNPNYMLNVARGYLRKHGVLLEGHSSSGHGYSKTAQALIIAGEVPWRDLSDAPFSKQEGKRIIKQWFKRTKPDLAVVRDQLPGKKKTKRIRKVKADKVINPRSDSFLGSWEWRTLRYKVIQKYGRKCMCCGASPGNGTDKICVDHIKPRHTHPELALDITNLQVLCDECNMGKGAWDATDFRSY